MNTLMFKAIQSEMKTKEGEKLWYPRLISRGNPATVEDMAEMLCRLSSVSRGDVYSIFLNLPEVFKAILMDGRTLHFDGVGTFKVTIRSKYGVKTKEEVSPDQIESLNIIFTPTEKRFPVDGRKYPIFSDVTFERVE